MPQITLANSIGQPTSEIQAQTQKQHFKPLIVNSDGSITNPNTPPKSEGTTEQPAPTLEAKPEIPSEAPVDASITTLEPKKEESLGTQASDKSKEDQERLSALIRREKALRAKVRQAEENAAKVKAEYETKETERRAEIERASKAMEWQDRLKTDLIGTLTDAGYTSDQITQALLNQSSPESPAVKALYEKISQMEKSQQQALEAQKQEADKNYQNALKSIERNVKTIVTANPDKFESLAANEAEGQVVKYIEEVWKSEGIMLDVEDAAQEIEDYLTEQTMSLTSLKKIQNRLKPSEPAKTETPVEAKPEPAAVKPPTPTLTNKIAQHNKPLTAKERAILAFKGQLK